MVGAGWVRGRVPNPTNKKQCWLVLLSYGHNGHHYLQPNSFINSPQKKKKNSFINYNKSIYFAIFASGYLVLHCRSRNILIFCFLFLFYIIRAEVLGRVKEWTLPDCMSVHKLLETDFNDPDAASRKLSFD